VGHRQQSTKKVSERIEDSGNGNCNRNSNGDVNGNGDSNNNDANANNIASMTAMRMTHPGCALLWWQWQQCWWWRKGSATAMVEEVARVAAEEACVEWVVAVPYIFLKSNFI
jgi:hypothetical protein